VQPYVTVIAEPDEYPSTDARITVVPTPDPVTSPDEETLATLGLSEVHENVLPDNALPGGGAGARKVPRNICANSLPGCNRFY
jgi:hypothetical protein